MVMAAVSRTLGRGPPWPPTTGGPAATTPVRQKIYAKYVLENTIHFCFIIESFKLFIITKQVQNLFSDSNINNTYFGVLQLHNIGIMKNML